MKAFPTDRPPARPLDGVRVLDLTQFLSGPFGTMVLADLGADVVKVEPPEGELARHVGPHFVGGDSAYFLSINRGKRSVNADLKTPEGIALVRSLALHADVVIENNRPGVLERLGLSYEEIRVDRPGIVWCSISGFGQQGPWRDWPAYDMVVQALSGGMSLTGEPDGVPVRAGIPLADLSAGMFATIGVLAALNERQRTGQGRWVDIAMLDCQLSMLCYQAAYYLHSGQVPGRQGSGHDSIPTYRGFRARDGVSVVITANTERMWRSLVKVLGVSELAEDARFLTNADRFTHREALWPLLEHAFLSRPAAEWMPLLIEEGVPAGVVNPLDRALGSEQAQARNMVLDLAGGDATPRQGLHVRVAGNPVKFVDEPEPHYRFPPALGQDTGAVLRDWLGEAGRDDRRASA